MANVRLYPRTALVLLTALNLLNYIDRSVLFAVQPLVQAEFHLTNAQVAYLTSAFLLFYMVAAPFTGPLADRYSRKLIIAIGAFFWSGLTLLTAVTHSYQALLVRHTLVGIGEASFVTIAPTFVADLFPEEKRGRILGVFYLAIPVGTALGYVLGGNLGTRFGWRFPFYIAAFPGFLLALMMLFIPEPPRGQFDSVKETAERGTIRGLTRNPAFWTATLGIAMMTFALGGIQVWMLELARRLPDAQVTVIAPAAPGDARFDSTSRCRVLRVGSMRLGRFRWLVQLTLATVWACITDRPDLIACGHVLTAPPALARAVASTEETVSLATP